MLVPTDKSKDTLKKYEEQWTKIRYIVRSTSNDSDDYGKQYMKIKFNSDDNLPLKKTLELYSVIAVLGLFFMKATYTIYKFS